MPWIAHRTYSSIMKLIYQLSCCIILNGVKNLIPLSCSSTQWFKEDTNAKNGGKEKKQRKAKTKMGDIHHMYIWYDGNSKQSGIGQASISQRRLGRDVFTRTCSQKKIIM